jgi:hypothetical protein
VNTAVGTSGVEAGPDGYVSAVHAQSSQIKISGLDTAGKGPGSDLNVVTINFTAGNNECSTNLGLTVQNLVDETTTDIPANPGDGSVNVTGASKGDVNDDGSVGIVDALLVAQYYVGMIVSINTEAADVDCNGSINIVDALQIAQYYVGLINHFF